MAIVALKEVAKMSLDNLIISILTSAVFGSLSAGVVNFILQPAKEQRYAISKLKSDLTRYRNCLMPGPVTQEGLALQREASRELRWSACDLEAACLRIYFYKYLNKFGLIPDWSLIMGRDETGASNDGIIYRIIGISNTVGAYDFSDKSRDVNDERKQMRNELQEVETMLRKSLDTSLVETLWARVLRR
jgi:hypothetical protein